MDIYLLRQSLVAFACLAECFGCGTIVVFTSTLFAQLEKDFEVSKQEESWIASSAILSMSFGSILGGYLMQKCRKKTILITSSLLRVMSFYSIYKSLSYHDLILGRAIMGLTLGLSRPVVVALIGEASHPSYRGFFMNVVPFGTVLGAFGCDLFGTLFHWTTNALLCALYPLLTVATILFLPETYGNFIKENLEGATDAFYWYRGVSGESVEEFCSIRLKEYNAEGRFSIASMDRSFFKALFVCALFFTTAQLTGMNGMLFYANLIYEDIFSTFDASLVVLALDSLRFLLSSSCGFIIRRHKVRPLTFCSIVGVAASLFALSAANFLLSSNVDEPGDLQRQTVLNYCILVALFTYSSSTFLSLCTVIWTLPAELFTSECRGFGSGSVIFLNYLVEFAVVKFTPQLMVFGYDWMFLFFACCTTALGMLLMAVLPETKDLSLVEAQAMLANDKPQYKYTKFDIMEDSLRYVPSKSSKK